MGNVAITLKVMPASPDVDIAEIKSGIQNMVEAQEIREEPIGFGLTALKVLIVVPDSSGGTDEIEKKIASVAGVASVETEDVTLL